MMKGNFADLLLEKIDEKKSPLIVGLDSDYEKLPEFMHLKEPSEEHITNSLLEFNKRIIDNVEGYACGLKLQAAFYEKYSIAGLKAFKKTIEYAHSHKLLVIADVKRGDLGTTAQAYSSAYLKPTDSSQGFGSDAITVNPLMGTDAITPFLEDCRQFSKGVFVLVKTSNPSSSEIQDLDVKEGNSFTPLYLKLARLTVTWGSELVGKRGFSSVGAVVGATYPEHADMLRKEMPHSLFLVPGYGAQGASADDVCRCFNLDGYGAIVNSSRAIIYGFKSPSWKGGEKEYGEAAGIAASKAKDELVNALEACGKKPF